MGEEDSIHFAPESKIPEMLENTKSEQKPVETPAEEKVETPAEEKVETPAEAASKE